MPRGGYNRKGDYLPDRPTDYVACAQRIVALADYQRESIGLARACRARALTLETEGAVMWATLQRASARAHLENAARHAAGKRKWRLVYSAAVANAFSSVLA